jgi:hypothetical protein
MKWIDNNNDPQASVITRRSTLFLMPLTKAKFDEIVKMGSN